MSSEPQPHGLTDAEIRHLRTIVAQRRQVRNAAEVSAELCDQLRREMVEHRNTELVADGREQSISTIRRHIAGRCQHDNEEPSWTWDRHRHAWIRNTPGGERDGD